MSVTPHNHNDTEHPLYFEDIDALRRHVIEFHHVGSLSPLIKLSDFDEVNEWHNRDHVHMNLAQLEEAADIQHVHVPNRDAINEDEPVLRAHLHKQHGLTVPSNGTHDDEVKAHEYAHRIDEETLTGRGDGQPQGVLVRREWDVHSHTDEAMGLMAAEPPGLLRDHLAHKHKVGPKALDNSSHDARQILHVTLHAIHDTQAPVLEVVMNEDESGALHGVCPFCKTEQQLDLWSGNLLYHTHLAWGRVRSCRGSLGKPSQYPQHDLWDGHFADERAVKKFIEFLRMHEYVLYDTNNQRVPLGNTARMVALLCEHFGIDYQAYMDEKNAMLRRSRVETVEPRGDIL